MNIEYSDVDRKLNLNPYSCANIVQNKMINFLGEINLTSDTLRKDYGAFWVVAKLKIHFYDYPMLNDNVFCSTYPSNKSKIRLNLDYVFSDQNKNTFFLAKQELCPVDIETRKIRKLDSIDNIELNDSNLDISFSRWAFNLDEFEKCFDYTVLYCDTDSNCHVNNANYVRFILNTFDADFFDNHTIRDLEIHYINECLEKETIHIYRKQLGNEMLFIITCADKIIIKAKLIFDA